MSLRACRGVPAQSATPKADTEAGNHSGFAEGFSTSGVMMSAQWGAQLTVAGIVWPIVFMWLVSVVAALYPAAKAARLDPVRALTHV